MARLSAYFDYCQATGRRWLRQFAAAGLMSPRHQPRNLGPNAVLPNPFLEYGISNAIMLYMDKVLGENQTEP